MKPFNLERALAGDAVVTRDGREATQITLFDTKTNFSLAAVVDGVIYTFTEIGELFKGKISNKDLFMKTEERIVYAKVISSSLGRPWLSDGMFPNEEEARAHFGKNVNLAKITWEE